MSIGKYSFDCKYIYSQWENYKVYKCQWEKYICSYQWENTAVIANTVNGKIVNINFNGVVSFSKTLYPKLIGRQKTVQT